MGYGPFEGSQCPLYLWFALTQLLGYSHVREYDRSWAEWGNLHDVPVAIGNSPMPANDWNIPGNWVEIYHNIFIPAMIGEWVPRVLALADPKPGENVLDVACGTGALTRAIAEAVGQNGSVTGVDISPDMLGLAREHTLSKFPAIEWREGDAQSLPFEDAVFDVAFCQLGLMFFPDKVAALKEIRRVLKPSGRAAVMVWGAIDRCPGQMAMAKTWEELYDAEQAAKFYRQHSLSDPENLRSLMVAAGFQEIEVNLTMGTMRFQSAEHLVRSYGALGQDPADERVRNAAIDAVTQALRSYVGPEGLVYPIEAVLARANASARPHPGSVPVHVVKG